MMLVRRLEGSVARASPLVSWSASLLLLLLRWLLRLELRCWRRRRVWRCVWLRAAGAALDAALKKLGKLQEPLPYVAL